MVTEKIGFGGGCHWCTEAVFASLTGVERVEQGWIADQETGCFSEAVIVHYNPGEIDLTALVAVHLYTHSSTSNHGMRSKYRSAVYVFSDTDYSKSRQILGELQPDFEKPLVTEVRWFDAFRPSIEEEQDYYYKNPAKPFCQTHIHPKLAILLKQFPSNVDAGKIKAAATDR